VAFMHVPACCCLTWIVDLCRSSTTQAGWHAAMTSSVLEPVQEAISELQCKCTERLQSKAVTDVRRKVAADFCRYEGYPSSIAVRMMSPS
jgi:hypothetical protein